MSDTESFDSLRAYSGEDDGAETTMIVSFGSEMDTPGWIYCLSNQGYPYDVFKIGYTRKESVEMRAAELYTTGVMHPFDIVFRKFVAKPLKAETELHNLFANQRINPSREFFKLDLSDVLEAFNTFEEYDPEKDKKKKVKK